MKTVGFPISKKENEFRRALLPKDVADIQHPECLYFEKGYGNVLGYSDADYLNLGAHVVERVDVLSKDIICDAKIGDAEYLDVLNNQTIFGWVHAVQNRDITDKLIAGKITAYAWEDMFSDGRHLFYRNNEIAGEAAIMHAFQCYGEMPYNIKAALLGRGNVARGALKILTLLGADVCIYDRKTEKLFQKELEDYDVVVNAILWDTNRKDHIIYRTDLERMKKGALIIDISCDRNGGIETSTPTTIDNPTYIVDGIMHYVVDHTPSLFYKTVSSNLSSVLPIYLNQLISDEVGVVLNKAKIIDKGQVIDCRINQFQNRNPSMISEDTIC